jgi:hypothetical protein
MRDEIEMIYIYIYIYIYILVLTRQLRPLGSRMNNFKMNIILMRFENLEWFEPAQVR